MILFKDFFPLWFISVHSGLNVLVFLRYIVPTLLQSYLYHRKLHSSTAEGWGCNLENPQTMKHPDRRGNSFSQAVVFAPTASSGCQQQELGPPNFPTIQMIKGPYWGLLGQGCQPLCTSFLPSFYMVKGLQCGWYIYLRGKGTMLASFMSAWHS